jgi:hypothetical protein
MCGRLRCSNWDVSNIFWCRKDRAKKKRKILCEYAPGETKNLTKCTSIHICSLLLPRALSLSFTTITCRLSTLDIVVATSIESNFKATSTLVHIHSQTKNSLTAIILGHLCKYIRIYIDRCWSKKRAYKGFLSSVSSLTYE